MTQRPRRTISLLAALLAVLVPLISAVAGAVMWQGYSKSSQASMGAGQQLFQSLQTEIAVQQQGLFEPLRFVISTLAADPDFGSGATDRYLNSFATILERYSHVSSFRVGFDSGELFEVIAFKSIDPGVAAAVMAPQAAAFAVHRIARAPATSRDKGTRETWVFLDAAHGELARTEVNRSEYDPRGREWFISAKKTPGELVETAPYVFDFSNQPGISVAKTLGGSKPGVISADITLSQMSSLVGGLAADSNQQLFFFYGAGDVVAHPEPDKIFGPGPWNPNQPLTLPNMSTLSDPVAKAMVAEFQRQGAFGIQTLRVAGVPYLAAVVPLGTSPMHMALALPESNFTGVLQSIGRDGLLISLGILALSIPLILLVARRFSQPLVELAQQTDRIAQFDLTFSDNAPSRIAEISQLSESMTRMKTALSQITKFVPKSLVQDLVRSGTRMEVGGERRLISVVFTDVKDFTTLAEKLPAEELMAQMSEYFDVVVRAVFANGGTVDKYVGDAVFAFWNAPSRQPDHEVLAWRAALAARAASNELNVRWKGLGKPEWYTRLGVHVGDAVVGNVGSSDRLDYTAIGDTVNMGSRLEGLNKVYGTQILASGPIATKTASHFHYRPIDIVIPKGALLPIEIFELMAERSGDDSACADLIAAWQPVIDQYRKQSWPTALDALRAFAARYPADEPAKTLRARMEGFLSTAPPPSWDGVTRFENK